MSEMPKAGKSTKASESPGAGESPGASESPRAGESPGADRSQPAPRFALFEAGFRPFFLAAGLSASANLIIWPLVLTSRLGTPGGWSPVFWHAHELVFGFAAAAIAGFLLTAVPNWTGTQRVSGGPLALLVAAWIAGRIAVWTASALPPGVVAGLDLLFLPLLAGAVGLPIVRARKPHNYPVVVILIVLSLANLAVHLQMMGLADGSARQALRFAVYLVIVLVTIISGRIVPLFTKGYLRRSGIDAEIADQPRLETALIPTLLLAAALAVFWEGSLAGALASLAAAALLLLRQLRWHSAATRNHAILWVLHVGHAWLVLGFGLLGLAGISGTIPASSGFHSLTAGAIGTMVLGVMSRVSLGHSGREITAGRTTVVAYGLVILGGAMRVMAPLAPGSFQANLFLLSGGTWALAYLVFSIRYAPLLLRPRVDGRPG